MYRKIDDFLNEWEGHSRDTLKILDALSDAALQTTVADGHRNLGRMAWHIVQTLSEMMAAVGLEVAGPGADAPVPAQAAALRAAYAEAAASLAAGIRAGWNDETLTHEDDLYGERWARGFTLRVLIAHEIHHRGQMTVLMRQAGLAVPGVYGPAREEWAGHGLPEPAV